MQNTPWAPVIGASKPQEVPPAYRIERRDKKTGQLKTAWIVNRDRLKVGDVIKWGYGARWTVVEVRG